jgi:hypothetical protein
MEWPPAALDPELLALLRAVARGVDDAVASLADWLEGHGYPWAAAIRELTRLEPVVRETRTGANEVSRFVDFHLDGKRCCVTSSLLPAFAGDTDNSLAQHLGELLRDHQTHEVLQRLCLSPGLSSTLQQYLGINQWGIAVTVEEMAQRAGKPVQTIRNRIELALHRLATPDPHGRKRSC